MKVLMILLASAIISVGGPGYVSAGEVTLQWDANTEPDLAGYKIYYGSSTGVYDGTLAIVDGMSKPSPIDVGNVTTVTIDLPNGTWFFVATAYDNEVPSLESDYSNEVFKRISNGAPAAPQNFIEKLIAWIKNLFRSLGIA